MRCTPAALLALVTVLAGACVTGRTPPEKTPLVPVKGGLFLFGAGDEPCASMDQVPFVCGENLDLKRPKTWPTVLVDIPDFFIEEREVTNRQYEYCVLLGKCDEPVAFLPKYPEQYFANPAYDEHPVLNITYRMAEQYCAFVGRRLPYEWEWERVAAGPATTLAEKRRYPLTDRDGNPVDIRECTKDGGPDVAMNACNGEFRTRPVGTSAGDVVYEDGKPIYDLAGNAAEYVAGYFREDVTCERELQGCIDCWSCGPEDQTCQGDCYLKCDDCKQAGDACFRACGEYPICIAYPPDKPQDIYVSKGDRRLARGGSYLDPRQQSCFASTTDRRRTLSTDQENQAYYMGIRCAADAP